MASRETENNAYAKFWGDKQRALWYVMVFLEWSIEPLSLRLAAKKNSVFFTLGFILIEFYSLFGTLNK